MGVGGDERRDARIEQAQGGGVAEQRGPARRGGRKRAGQSDRPVVLGEGRGDRLPEAIEVILPGLTLSEGLRVLGDLRLE
jgi:hypothetical protein